MPLSAALRSAANAGGGWPYYPGAASRIEPTSWAILALAGGAAAAPPPGGPVDLEMHASHLLGLADGTGLLIDPGTTVPNLAWNGLALLALRSLPSRHADGPLFAAVAAARGVRLENDPTGVLGQDNQLQAWAWIPGTFSWVEPTAYCLLALKQRAGARLPDADARVAEAERLLLDRVCPEGGWNYGNSSVLGQDLRPYVPTTALALLALQDRGATAVDASVAWLEWHAIAERSAMALSLAAIALAIHRRSIGRVIDALRAQLAATGFLGNAHLTAMAQFALTLDRHDAAAFRLPPAGRAR